MLEEESPPSTRLKPMIGPLIKISSQIGAAEGTGETDAILLLFARTIGISLLGHVQQVVY